MPIPHYRQGPPPEPERREPPAAGWYPDPRMADTRRYWDGAGWTEHVSAAAPTAGAERMPSNLATLGYLCAVLFPIAGFLIGLSQARTREGPSIIAWSIGCGVFWGLAALNLAR